MYFQQFNDGIIFIFSLFFCKKDLTNVYTNSILYIEQ